MGSKLFTANKLSRNFAVCENFPAELGKIRFVANQHKHCKIAQQK